MLFSAWFSRTGRYLKNREMRFGRYKHTDDNVELNVLCEFLRIQNNVHLEEFYENHGESEFGKMLYNKYMKVAFEKERIEKVENMQLYQAKTQVKYLSDNDVEFIWEQSKEETSEEIACDMFLDGEDIIKIKKYTKLSEEKLSEILADLPEKIQSKYKTTDI